MEISRHKPGWEYPPSAAIAVVRLKDTELEYLRLADVTVAVGTQRATAIIQDTLGLERERYLTELDRTSGPDAVRRALTARRRDEMNQPGGYWVLADSPAAVRPSTDRPVRQHDPGRPTVGRSLERHTASQLR